MIFLIKPNCLLLEYISEEALTILEAHTNIQVVTTSTPAVDIASKTPITAIATRGSGVVNESLIKISLHLPKVAATQHLINSAAL